MRIGFKSTFFSFLIKKWLLTSFKVQLLKRNLENLKLEILIKKYSLNWNLLDSLKKSPLIAVAKIILINVDQLKKKLKKKKKGILSILHFRIWLEQYRRNYTNLLNGNFNQTVVPRGKTVSSPTSFSNKRYLYVYVIGTNMET